MPRHFLEIDDLKADELTAVLDAAQKPPMVGLLAGKGVALVFEKPSLRTRNSSEMAVVQLGGHPVFIQQQEIQLGKRETIEDVTRVLAGYYSVISARVFEHKQLERMAAVSPVPVVNLLSDGGHPCQALADLLTIRNRFGTLGGVPLAWVGDFNNVARSLSLGAMLSGMDLRVASPPGYGPTPQDLDRLAALDTPRGGRLVVHARPTSAVAGAMAVSTDTWVSMGQEGERTERLRAFEGFGVDGALMAGAACEGIFLHCLPAKRGQEVTDEVMEGPQSMVFTQAHNRMHAYRGLLTWLLTRPSEG